jgi:outer membrane protein OmpA-like peptidoglycan-associated protein
VSKGKLLAVCLIWLMLASIGAATYKFVVEPMRRDRLVSGTGSASRYAHDLTLSLDSFSGYAILRSPEFQSLLGEKGIRVALQDDGASYADRIEALRTGKSQFAVFTIDALLKVCADLGYIPGTIVAVIDETRGADAMVAYREAFPNLDALNNPKTRFVLTPDSPSETLARAVMANFHLDKLGERPFIEAQDAEDVYRRYRAATQVDPLVFVLWEPYVTKMNENPNTYIVVDSERFRGFIVDVLVVNRDYLLKNPEVVQDVVGCYFRAAYQYRDRMVELVLEDAKQTGTPLNKTQAENLVNGIWWKNTQENFAHFGIGGRQHAVQLLEDMIRNIGKVLLTTKAIEKDPTGGQPTSLYYDEVMRALETSNFHPALADEQIRDDHIELAALNDEQWKQIVPIGTLQVPELVFARGTARLTGLSTNTLDELVTKLNNWPQYYLEIRGKASSRGDAEANRRLAQQRAEAAQAYLIQAGVDAKRIRPITAAGTDTSFSVSFVLGELPY